MSKTANCEGVRITTNRTVLVQIEQYNRVARISRSSGLSISSLYRMAMGSYLDRNFPDV